MSEISAFTTEFIAFVQSAPPLLSGAVLALTVCIEYLIPPFPGDTLLIVAAFLAARGALSWPLTILMLTLGSFCGIAASWGIGRAAATHPRIRQTIYRFFTPATFERIEQTLQQYGNRVLLANRFLPGIRGAFLFATGFFHIPLSRVLFWGTLSAFLWNTLLITVGYGLHLSLDSMLMLVRQYYIAATIVLAALSLVYMLAYLKKKSNHSK